MARRERLRRDLLPAAAQRANGRVAQQRADDDEHLHDRPPLRVARVVERALRIQAAHHQQAEAARDREEHEAEEQPRLDGRVRRRERLPRVGDRELARATLRPLRPPSARRDHVPCSYHVYCSPLNPGGLALMEEVARARGFEVSVADVAPISPSKPERLLDAERLRAATMWVR